MDNFPVAAVLSIVLGLVINFGSKLTNPRHTEHSRIALALIFCGIFFVLWTAMGIRLPR